MSQEPVASQRIQPTLSSLPEKIQQRIINKLDLASRFTLRKYSKQFRALIDKTPLSFNQISLKLGYKLVFLKLEMDTPFSEELSLEYQKCPIGTLLWKNGKILHDSCHLSTAVKDLGTILLNPNVSIREFSFPWTNYTEEYPEPYESYLEDKEILFSEVQKVLYSLEHGLDVREFEISMKVTFGDVLKVLPYIKAENLEEIVLDFLRPLNDSELDMTHIVTSEQWKKAESLKLTGAVGIPIRHFLHFKKVQLTGYEPSLDDIKVLIKTCSTTNHSFYLCALDYCHDLAHSHIIHWAPLRAPEEGVLLPFRVLGDEDDDTEHWSVEKKKKIEGTEDYVGVIITKESVSVFRTK